MDNSNWDLIQSAAAYSTLSGILAGFALTAVTVVVTVVASGRSRRSQSMRDYLEMTIGWLVTSFFSLLLVSFLFAVLSGHDRFVTTVDSATHQLTYGVKTMQPLLLGLPLSMLFSSAAIQLFLGIVWLFELVHLGKLAQLCARVMFWFLIPLSAVHIHSYYGTIDIERTHQAPTQSLQFWAVAGVAVLIPCVVAVLARTPDWARWKTRSGRSNKHDKVASTATTNASPHDRPLARLGAAVRGAKVRYASVLASLALTLGISISFGVLESMPESSFSSPNLDLSGAKWLVYGLLAVLWSLYVLGLPRKSAASGEAATSSIGGDTAKQRVETVEKPLSR